MKAYTASSAKEALRIIESEDAYFDLGILDMQASGLNGVELAQTIREIPFKGDMPSYWYRQLVKLMICQKAYSMHNYRNRLNSPIFLNLCLALCPKTGTAKKILPIIALIKTLR